MSSAVRIVGFLHSYGVGGLHRAKKDGVEAWATPCHPSAEAFKTHSDAVAVCLVSDADAAIAGMRDQLARILEMSSQDIRLMAGEMSAQEMRTVKAILAGVRARITK